MPGCKTEPQVTRTGDRAMLGPFFAELKELWIGKRRNYSDASYAAQLAKLDGASVSSASEIRSALSTSFLGLDPDEAARRLVVYGANTVLRERPVPWWTQLPYAFNSACIRLLA